MSKFNWNYTDEKLPEETGWYIVYAENYDQGSAIRHQNVEGIMFAKFYLQSQKWSIESRKSNYGCVKAWHSMPNIPYRYKKKKK